VRKLAMLSLMAGAIGSNACAVRSDNIYAEDVRKVLEARGNDVSQCWGEVMKTNPNASGAVAVRLRVEEDTGAIVNPEIDPSQTTAPPELQQCVLQSLGGLALQPADNRTGVGVYVWNFNPAPAG
jgi:hypothetical protein